MARTPYDINASWDDPYERRQERRSTARTPARITVKLALHLANKPTPLVGPAVVDDISTSGMRCRTKHRLSPGQSIRVYMSTREFSSQLGLPRAFTGSAQVTRSTLQGEGVSEVALRFDEELRDDIQLAIFVDHLHALARTTSSR